jgi:hypothetical protein
VALLSIHPQSGIPRVVSTDRHFTQGALELAGVTWNDATYTLSGTSLGPAGTAHNISIYFPPEFRWDSDHPDYFQESGQYSMKQASSNILRVRARFDSNTSMKWQVKFVPAGKGS